MKTSSLFLFALLVSCATFAQQPTQQPQAQHVVIHAGHMLDVKTGKMLDNVTVVIDGEKVTSVSSGGGSQSDNQAGIRVINLAQCHASARTDRCPHPSDFRSEFWLPGAWAFLFPKKH